MKITKKKLGAFVAGAALVAGAGSAFAYWTTTGAGNGSATAATSNGTVVLHASYLGGIYPGGTASVTFTADNAGATNLYVGTIHLASVAVDVPHSTCVVADFTMPDVVSNTVVAGLASGAALTGTGTLSFANTSANQDACKGATITLNLTSN